MKKIGVFILITSLHFTALKSFSQAIQGTYAIKNIETGMVLRMKDANKNNGTPVVLYSPANWKCATWDFKHIDGTNYQLRNLFTNKTFQPENVTLTDGVALEQQPLILNQNNQVFEFIRVEKNTYLIKLKGSDLYITPSNKKGDINSRILLTGKKNTKDQYWTLHEQHPEI